MRALAWLAALSLAFAAGCGGHRPAPVIDRMPDTARKPPSPPAAARGAEREPDWRPATYVVKRGDTLIAIALEHGLEYREIAEWNRLANPNRIFVGQVLALRRPGSAPVATPPAAQAPAPVATPAPEVAPAPAGPVLLAEPRAVKVPYSDQALARMKTPDAVVAKVDPAPPRPVEQRTDAKPDPRPVQKPAAEPAAKPVPPAADAPPSAVAEEDGIAWAWPASGRVIAGFSESRNLKGLDIAGLPGQTVAASADGRVVYVGDSLRGYGNLIIVKHNDTYLTAYAHNSQILVKEGQRVARGQKIAEMGATDADRVKLHFQIRRLGKPVDPAKFLPAS